MQEAGVTARGWLLFATLSVVWGLSYLLIKIAVAGLSVPVLVFARVSIGALVLLPFAIRGFPISILFKHWRPLVAFATFEFALPWGLLSHAEVRISSSTAGLLMATIPVLAVVIGRLTGSDEVIGLRRSAGLALGFAGVFVLAGPDWTTDLVAMLEVLGAASAYAAGGLVAGRGLKAVPALPMTAVCLVIAALMYLPAAVIAWPETLPSARSLVALGLLAVVCTSLAFVWFFGLIREVGVSRAMVITYVNPAVAVVAGVLVLSEPFTMLTFVAFGLILMGSLLATSRTEVAQQSKPERSGV
jgi:drug/metabolite transporter (DMT)-like permease